MPLQPPSPSWEEQEDGGRKDDRGGEEEGGRRKDRGNGGREDGGQLRTRLWFSLCGLDNGPNGCNTITADQHLRRSRGRSRLRRRRRRSRTKKTTVRTRGGVWPLKTTASVLHTRCIQRHFNHVRLCGAAYSSNEAFLPSHLPTLSCYCCNKSIFTRQNLNEFSFFCS